MNQAEEETAMPSAAFSQPPLRPGRGMSWPAAREQAYEGPGRQLSPQWLPLEAACGCPLRVDLLALTDLPATDISAMDGWAVAGPPPWRVVADLPAGRVLDRWLADGECAGIATGAVVPHGADAVLPIEHSLRDSAWVRGRPEAVLLPGTHIRRAGEEAHRGDVLLPGHRGDPSRGRPGRRRRARRPAGHSAGDCRRFHPRRRDHLERTAGTGPGPGCARAAIPAWLAAFGTARPSITVLPDRLPDLSCGPRRQRCGPGGHDRRHERRAAGPCPGSRAERRRSHDRGRRAREAGSSDAPRRAAGRPMAGGAARQPAGGLRCPGDLGPATARRAARALSSADADSATGGCRTGPAGRRTPTAAGAPRCRGARCYPSLLRIRDAARSFAGHRTGGRPAAGRSRG